MANDSIMKTRLAITTLMIFMLIPQVFGEGPGNKEKVKAADAKAMITLSGTVVDRETGEGLAGALVKIDGTETTVYTDFDGKFTISVVPGSYTISTKLISYETALMKVTAESREETIKVSLENVAKKR